MRTPTSTGSCTRTPALLAVAIGILLGHHAARADEAPATRTRDGAPRVAGYRGIWFTLGQRSELGDKYSGGLGTYTANHLPMAVYAAQVDRTFFVYGGTPAADQRRLLCMAGYFDHKTGRVPRPVVVHEKKRVNDPHDNPAINIDEQGHLWVFVSGRARARMGYKYRSVEPYSIDAFERVEEKEMTYPQVHVAAGKGFLHLFTKYTTSRPRIWAGRGRRRTGGRSQRPRPT